jgi:Rrf2 family nitric oxide-sensitive transcriptional repressor
VMTARCRLKARLAAARETFLAELDRTTLAECAWG